MYKVLICQHNTLNFIDGVGNMKICSPMKNHFPVGQGENLIYRGGEGGQFFFFSLLICQKKDVIMNKFFLVIHAGYDSCKNCIKETCYNVTI